jgi:CMP-N,N'-diacetyllegionaminic acid synthase
MNIITVIPARGGSKSIPFKNIKMLNGMPLMSYSIEYSTRCYLVKDTIVYTDSEKIANIAKEYGANVPFLRPKNIADDETQDFPVIQHALEELEKIQGEKIDAIVLLRPTSPLRPLNLIERAVDILNKNPDCTSVRSVVKSSEHVYRQWNLLDDGTIAGVISSVFEPYNIPRQKLPNVYFQSGDIEVIRRDTIINGSISGNKVFPLILEQEEMLDIDYIDDLKIAENKLNKV